MHKTRAIMLSDQHKKKEKAVDKIYVFNKY